MFDSIAYTEDVSNGELLVQTSYVHVAPDSTRWMIVKVTTPLSDDDIWRAYPQESYAAEWGLIANSARNQDTLIEYANS